MSKSNPIGWIEIPVNDMDRAIIFYNAVMGWTLEKQAFGDTLMAWFPFDHSANGASGTLIQQANHYEVSDKAGALVYFSCDDVADPLAKVTPAGGTVLQEKTQISEEHGYMGLAIDSEGNRIAFHSN